MILFADVMSFVSYGFEIHSLMAIATQTQKEFQKPTENCHLTFVGFTAKRIKS